eukprot:235455-Chlamydomonas_euryale.AAC.1
MRSMLGGGAGTACMHRGGLAQHALRMAGPVCAEDGWPTCTEEGWHSMHWGGLGQHALRRAGIACAEGRWHSMH